MVNENITKMRIMIIIVFIILLLTIIFLNFNSKKNEICGNEICEKEENCQNCIEDCSCSLNEECLKGECTIKKNKKETEPIKEPTGKDKTENENCQCKENEQCINDECVYTCGDGICQTHENCFSCFNDCRCDTSETCHKGLKKCVQNSYCGNGICEKDENCENCPRDCFCQSGEFCSKGLCIEPKCGNGICEPYEDSLNCCLDCSCKVKDMVCDTVKFNCRYPYSNMSMNRAREITEKYIIEDLKSEFTKIEVKEDFVYEGITGKQVQFYLKNENYPKRIIVLDTEEIVELVTI